MRAVVVEAADAINVTTVPDPAPWPGEAVVEVGACGLCGIDSHLVEGALPMVRYPIVPGHELAGRVAALGGDVIGLAEGDMVAVDPSLPCGRCGACRLGRGDLCESGQFLGVTVAGGAAEYVCVPAMNCYPLPVGTTATAGALIEPLACVLHGCDRVSVDLTDDVLIFGATTTGLLLTQVLRRAGIASVSLVDTHWDRLTAAESLGGSAVATSVAVLAAGQGWPLVVDTTGEPTALEESLNHVRRGGTFLQFGETEPAATAALPTRRLYAEEITIVGSRAAHNSFDRARNLLIAGTIDVRACITETTGLAEYEDPLARFRSGAGLKTQVLPAIADQRPD